LWFEEYYLNISFYFTSLQGRIYKFIRK
jgi:hypothetical protein